MQIDYTYDEEIGPLLSFELLGSTYAVCFCHRKRERSFFLFGQDMYLCSRCLGILLGSVFSIILYLFSILLPFYLSCIFLVPLLVDGFSQALLQRESNNYIRLCTGLLFGMGLCGLGFFTGDLIHPFFSFD